ncbi:tRNA 2'-phosphotransferase 1 isoform X2 [Choloepus didactylus]|uniref:tRNA 2'-phosphotransferase 1 isoform X2 n=1 Tax=Choloepus didactylus TaxID=27675 RepID=UPI00189F44F8|nr:tRNA 2'-phosphotransferase 1 isoform X2 [Choloepus didactylus]
MPARCLQILPPAQTCGILACSTPSLHAYHRAAPHSPHHRSPAGHWRRALAPPTPQEGSHAGVCHQGTGPVRGVLPPSPDVQIGPPRSGSASLHRALTRRLGPEAPPLLGAEVPTPTSAASHWPVRTLKVAPGQPPGQRQSVSVMNTSGGGRQEAAGHRGRRAPRPREQDPDVRLSKALSYALRHGAVKLGLPMGADGFVPLGALLQLPQFRGFSAEDVQRVVDTNGKQRFALRPGDPGTGPLIRANQGHSLQVPELELMALEMPQALPPVLVHGTFWKHWPSIRLKGLSCQGRTHIHLAPGLPGDPGVISGQCPHPPPSPRLAAPTQSVLPGPPSRGTASLVQGHPMPCMQQQSPARPPACPRQPGPSSSCLCRHADINCQVAVFIDGAKALADGIPFFCSTNGVILTPGNADGFLPPKYFKEALQLRPTRKPLSLAGDEETECQSGSKHSPREREMMQQ